jgi:hypothetical protein
MYINGKLRTTETIPGTKGKGNNEGSEFNYDMLELL